MKNNRNKLYIIVLIASLTVALISGTFGYFQASIENTTSISGTIASLGIDLKVERVTQQGNLIPLQESLLNTAVQHNCIDSNGYTACQVYKITVTNMGSTQIKVTGHVTLTGNDTTNLKWTQLTSATSYGGALTRGKDRSVLVLNDILGTGTNKDNIYYIMIYLKDIGEEQNSVDSGSFGGLVEFNTSNGTVSDNLNGNSLYNKIIGNAVMDNINSEFVNNTTPGINFNAMSSDTNGKGLYTLSSTATDTYPIHYYRGAVTNNNVIFGGFCWKIVRTTDTGGIKMIYNGTPTDGSCNNTGPTSQLENTSKFNSNYKSLSDVGYMYGTRYEYTSKNMNTDTTVYYYGKSVSYGDRDGDGDSEYTLSTDSPVTSGSWSSIYNGGLNNNHYTCFGTTENCEDTVNYIYYTDSTTVYYVTLTGGKTVEDAIDEMFNTDNVNETSGTIKGNNTITGTIDYWYYTYLNDYTTYLEDTVFCNDRSIYDLGPWNPDGGETTGYLSFGAYGRLHNLNPNRIPSLVCLRDKDKFTKSTSIGNGKLTHPVGLLTADEAALAGTTFLNTNYTYYLYTGEYYWLLSPWIFKSYNAFGVVMKLHGELDFSYVDEAYGIRPVVSLRPGIGVTGDGDGSVESPYEIEMN